MRTSVKRWRLLASISLNDSAAQLPSAKNYDGSEEQEAEHNYEGLTLLSGMAHSRLLFRHESQIHFQPNLGGTEAVQTIIENNCIIARFGDGKLESASGLISGGRENRMCVSTTEALYGVFRHKNHANTGVVARMKNALHNCGFLPQRDVNRAPLRWGHGDDFIREQQRPPCLQCKQG